MAPRAMVATSHPLAAQAGLDAMREGGTAVDAAIAACAVLGVVEPISTGIGGDLFALVHEAESGRLHALNASGRSPQSATMDTYRERGFADAMPNDGILSVTVPGAVSGWEALVERFGRQSLSHLLEPAIGYARDGFPVSEVVARRWADQVSKLERHDRTAETFLMNGRAPRAGERFRNPGLANSLAHIAQRGADALYRGPIAEAIAAESERLDGLLTLEDLADHEPTWAEPIGTDYRGVRICEHPPNTQGLIALLALNIAERFDLASMPWDSPERFHALVETTKLAFAHGHDAIADPDFAELPAAERLDKAYAVDLQGRIGEQAIVDTEPSRAEGGTVYVSAIDEQGNVASVIESIFHPFGAGVTAGDTGILLQNRGALFSLDPEHPNSVAPSKRSYHTILPAMAFKDNHPSLSFGMVGGFMQPQGHLQMLSNLIDHGMSVQAAIEAPRFRLFEGSRMALEPQISEATRNALALRGHTLIEGDGNFGGAQAIVIDPDTGDLHGGSDPRKDGCAQGF
ncbi:MAG: gamma-glutamyltransferase [Candidatus Bipolaricaulia bacterium]